MSSTEVGSTRKAQRELNRCYAIVRRVEIGANTGRNSAATKTAALAAFASATRAVLVVEDDHGVEAAAKLADRLTVLRQRAIAAHVLTAAAVLAIDREAIR